MPRASDMMMSRRNKITFLLLIVLVLSACSKENKKISAEIKKQFEASNTAPIDLRQVTPLSWERLCVIGPYASNESAAKTLGFKWDVDQFSSIGVNDTIYLLVFVKDNQVVAYTEHPRNEGDFLELKPRCLAREIAILKRKTDATGWVKLVYEP